MKTISLNGVWQLKGKKQTSDNDNFIALAAEVPGCAQLDLAKNGYLPEDIFMGENVLKTEEFEDFEWWYEKSFIAPDEKKNIFLVFEGVDCIAEYFLNDTKIGESDNMFIAHEFKIDDFLNDGENILTVHIKSPIIEADKMDYPLKMLTTPQRIESKHIRKAAHSYGWDIMPRLVTSGLWRGVSIEVRDSIYFTQTFFKTFTDEYKFFYTLDCNISDFSDVEIEISGSCGDDSTFYGRALCSRKYGAIKFNIENPKKWFPYGYGEPNIYDGTAKIFKKGILVHEEPLSFGIRTVTLDYREPAAFDDGQFRILINDIEIMCKGTNWVPLDAFHCRDAERYDRALALVKDIGCNILRCWGGNVYEDHYFFDFCDRNGIMVWQDFAMACDIYPEDESFKAKLTKEATAVIRKLRNHPSLILWAGDNEIDCCHDISNTDNNSLTREVLPKCVDLNDIGRPYLPSSPYISGRLFEKGVRTYELGTPLVEDHLWGPRDYHKSDYFKTSKAHFVSEIGYHGCPSMSSIRKFITPENVWPYKNNPEWILHSSDQSGNDWRMMLLARQIKQLFGYIPENPDDFVLASQISQAEANKYFIERMRVNRPDKTGIIWWNLIDGWPQFSDAVVDYYFEKKLSYHTIKCSQAPFAICADEIYNWILPVFACNDTQDEKRGTLKATDAQTDEILYEGEFYAAPNTSTKIAEIPTYYSEHKIIIFEWEIGSEHGMNHYLCGFPPISLDMYKKFIEKFDLK